MLKTVVYPLKKKKGQEYDGLGTFWPDLKLLVIATFEISGPAAGHLLDLNQSLNLLDIKITIFLSENAVFIRYEFEFDIYSIDSNQLISRSKL